MTYSNILTIKIYRDDLLSEDDKIVTHVVNENQLIGGQTDFNHSVVCNTFLNRISHLNIERVRSI